ncbi:glycosyltransferase family 2 protein [Allochromatium palmeri]|nr:glycosyltransferase family A protein [Allochromatium palmeri]
MSGYSLSSHCEPPLVSIVTTCKGRLDHLQQTIDRMLAQPQAQVVVVDYSCPQAVGDWVERCYPKARVVRVPGRQVYNASHSRNVGALQTATPWLLFVDADVLLAPDFLEQWLPRLQTSHSYHARPWIPSSMGTFLCTREAYDKIQGFDECMQGWGDEDRDFIARLSLAGYQADAYPVGLISIIEHSDALRMQNHAVNERQLSATINRTYINVKHDLMRLYGDELPLKRRRVLYQKVSSRVREAFQSRRVVEFAVPVVDRLQPTGWQCQSSLHYRVSPPTGVD